MLLSEYKDMLDALDLNSVAKAKQTNLQFIITGLIIPVLKKLPIASAHFNI